MSLSRESRSSYPEEDRYFRLIDETLLDQSRFGMSMDVAPPVPPQYPCEMSKTATQFLEEDDRFYAGRPLDHFDTKNVSEVLAIGDSMFQRVKFPGRSKRPAEQLNAYILTYAQHKTNVILLDLYNRLQDEVYGKWSNFHDPKLLHLNELKGAPIVNDLINCAVDFYLQDREEILTSTRLTTQREAEYFRGSYIMDPQNICRRKYQKSIQRDLRDPITPGQQVTLATRRQAEDTVPEPWHKGLGRAPPYMADYESADPKPLPTVTKEGSGVHHLAVVLQEKVAKLNRNVQGNAGMMSLTRAKEILYHQILAGCKRRPSSTKWKKCSTASSSRQNHKASDMVS